MNVALVENIKRVLKAKTILGCDVSKEDNVNLFFFKRYSESFLNRRTVCCPIFGQYHYSDEIFLSPNCFMKNSKKIKINAFR